MFGKSNRQRLKEFKELLKNKNDSDIEQVFNDDNFSIADNFVAEDYIDFMDDFDNPDSNDLFDIRQQYEHVIDLQDFEEEEDAQNFFGNTNMTPLYDNAILSDVEFSMGIMALAREKHLSDATINDVLNVFRSILPESNKVPATYNKVKTIVETNSPYNLLQKNIIFCASCKKDICVCGQVDKSILLVFDVQLQLEELLSRYQDIMDKYRNDMLQQTDYMDIHQSVYYRNTLIKYPNMLPFAIYTDGGRYTHTGAFEGWPVVLFLLDLPPKLRYKYSNIIFAGYWYSKRKPDWQFIFEKLDRLLRFSFNGREYRMKYLQVVADIPARQNLLSMINVPGYNCCYNCNIKGQYSGHVFFPYAPPIPRDPRTFIDCTDGVKGESVLQERIESFPGGVVIDVMHSVYRGPIEDDIKRLIAGFRRDEAVWGLIKFNQATVTKLDEMMTKVKFPKEYQRNKIRSLRVLSSWKVSELKLFGLYIVPTILIVIAKDENSTLQELVESMVIYTSAVRMLVQSRITEEMITSADQILHHWLSNRQRLWTKSGMTFKAHESLHLAKQVQMHGPLSTHSAFAGESAIGQIGKNITCYNADVSAKQIGERMSLRRASLIWLERNGKSHLKRYFNRERPTKSKNPEPSEHIVEFMHGNELSGLFKPEIKIDGFSISPFRQASDNTNCYVAVATEDGFAALKLMAILETREKDAYLCGYRLTTALYSNLINQNGFLSTQPLSYQYCCYGLKEKFHTEELVIFSARAFLAKYVFIEASKFVFFITMPHAYEHN